VTRGEAAAIRSLKITALLTGIAALYFVAAEFRLVPRDARHFPAFVLGLVRYGWGETDRAIRRGLGQTQETEQGRVERRTTTPKENRGNGGGRDGDVGFQPGSHTGGRR
jgi:hypothetical protein